MTPAKLTAEDRAALRQALTWARANGWRPRWPENRRSGDWMWASPVWPRFGDPPIGARRIKFEGRVLLVEQFGADSGWASDHRGNPSSLRQALSMLAAAEVLPEELSPAYQAGAAYALQTIDMLSVANSGNSFRRTRQVAEMLDKRRRVIADV